MGVAALYVKVGVHSLLQRVNIHILAVGNVHETGTERVLPLGIERPLDAERMRATMTSFVLFKLGVEEALRKVLLHVRERMKTRRLVRLTRVGGEQILVLVKVCDVAVAHASHQLQLRRLERRAQQRARLLR